MTSISSISSWIPVIELIATITIFFLIYALIYKYHKKTYLELIKNSAFMILMIGIIIASAILILGEMNHQVEDYEKNCTRYSIDNYTDNCMCPCDKPTWIERIFHLYSTCDGWIVKKNESCLSIIYTVES